MRNGFTLIELAIVLVIVGLLSGGILAGRDLIDAAKLRKVGSKANEYITAAQAFRAAYGQLPGDFSKATSIWGALVGTVSYGPDPVGMTAGFSGSCQLSTLGSQSSKATCNGNGNELIRTCDYLQDNIASSQYNICIQPFPNGYSAQNYGIWGYYERCAFWKHLANAGMITGQYTGNCTHANGVRANIDAPTTPYGGQSFYMALTVEGFPFFSSYHKPGLPTPGTLSSTDNLIGTCASPSGASFSNCGRLLTTLQAFSLDSKWDDGIPGTGKVQTKTLDYSTSASARSCITANPINASISAIVASNATYDLQASRNTPYCNLIFVF